MEPNLYRLFNEIPESASYAATPEELDAEDIAPEREAALKQIAASDNKELSIRAARLLCSWGDEFGFDVIRNFVLNDPAIDRGWLPHRLWGYDDTYRHIAYAVGRYWATHQDDGDGDAARAAILPVYIKLIGYSAILPFEVPLDFLMRAGFVELVPAVKEAFGQVLADPTTSSGKIEDLARVLLPYEREHVLDTLASHGRPAPPLMD